MENDAWEKLEKMLIAARVPRSMWPKFQRALRYHLLRRRIRKDEDFRRERAAMLARDTAEKERRSAFSLFVVLLLWLLAEQERARQSAADFARRSLLVLSQTDHARMAGVEPVEKGVACALLLSGIEESEAMRVLASDAACPGGLKHAARLQVAAMMEAPKAPTPPPTPAINPASGLPEMDCPNSSFPDPVTDDDADAPTWS